MRPDRHTISARLVFCLAFLGLIFGQSCGGPKSSVPHTVVAVQGRHVAGVFNAFDLKRAKQITTNLLNSIQSYQWPTISRSSTVPLRSLIPDSVGAWQLGEEPSHYAGKRLGEYLVNSQLYHDYGFVEMLGSAYYEKHLSQDPLLQVDLFDMGTSLGAFGIYSLQRNVQVRPEKIGDEAIITDDSLDAWKGRYYLKIQTWSIADALSEGMVRIAQEIFRRIGEAGDMSSLFHLFPTEMKIPGTERFFHTYLALDQITFVPTVNVLQLSPNTNGVLAEYRNKGSQLEFDALVAFAVEYPTPEEALAAFEFFRAYSHQQGVVTAAGIGALSFVTVSINPDSE